jgi:hypothetical protein
MPSLITIVKTLRTVKEGLDQAKELKDGRHWTATRNGKPVGPVKEVNAGLHGQELVVRVDFEENGAARQLRCEHGLFNNKDEITLDGTTVDLDDMVVSPHFQETPKRVVIEYKFKQGGADQRYVFEGKKAADA